MGLEKGFPPLYWVDVPSDSRRALVWTAPCRRCSAEGEGGGGKAWGRGRVAGKREREILRGHETQHFISNNVARRMVFDNANLIVDDSFKTVQEKN